MRLLANGASLAAETSAVVAAFILFSGGVLIALPHLLRVLRDLDAERAERIRAQQFAEVAAHMHDSVLHTLTLIQRADPRDVAGLARSQERELRAWLYGRHGRGPPPGRAGDVRRSRASSRGRGGGPPRGARRSGRGRGRALGGSLAACVAAAREALVNAAKYAGGAPISVFAEVESDGAAGRRVEVYVRDRGPGFDLDAVGADRMGIRESIAGRMARNGGHAEVRTAPGAGTEVRLEMRCE